MRTGCVRVAVSCPPTATAEADFLARPARRRGVRSPRATRGRSIGRDRPRAGVRAHDAVHHPTHDTDRSVAAPANASARIGRIVRANLSARRALRGRDPRRRGPGRRRGPARRPDRQAHRPLAAGQVHRPRALELGGKIWWGEVNRPIAEEHYDRLRARLMAYLADRDLSTPRTASSAPTRPTAARLRVYTETAWASIFARNLFRRPSAADLATFAPELHDHQRPVVQGRPGDRGHADRRPRSSSTSRRMEIIIVGTEYAGEIKKSAFTVMNYLMPDEGVLPMHSAVERRRRRRLGRLLRPRRDRQDDAVGRSRAEPHRRRRARLGRRRRLQLRGRLLREDDPPLADVRARHLPDDAPLRDDPRERRPRPARPASSTSTRTGSPRTPAAPTRSSSSATPTRPAWPASRRTSSS